MKVNRLGEFCETRRGDTKSIVRPINPSSRDFHDFCSGFFDTSVIVAY